MFEEDSLIVPEQKRPFMQSQAETGLMKFFAGKDALGVELVYHKPSFISEEVDAIRFSAMELRES